MRKRGCRCFPARLSENPTVLIWQCFLTQAIRTKPLISIPDETLLATRRAVGSTPGQGSLSCPAQLSETRSAALRRCRLTQEIPTGLLIRQPEELSFAISTLAPLNRRPHLYGKSSSRHRRRKPSRR